MYVCIHITCMTEKREKANWENIVKVNKTYRLKSSTVLSYNG